MVSNWNLAESQTGSQLFFLISLRSVQDTGVQSSCWSVVALHAGSRMAHVPDPASQRPSAGGLVIVVQLWRRQRLEESTWKETKPVTTSVSTCSGSCHFTDAQTDNTNRLTDRQRTSADQEKMEPTASTILAAGWSSGGRDLILVGGKDTFPVGFREGQQATHNLRQEQQT